MIAEKSSDLIYVIGDKAIVNPFYINMLTKCIRFFIHIDKCSPSK